MALSVEENVAADPCDVRLLRAPAVMASSHGLPDALQESRRPRTERSGFTGDERCLARQGIRHGDRIGAERAVGNSAYTSIRCRPIMRAPAPRGYRVNVLRLAFDRDRARRRPQIKPATKPSGPVMKMPRSGP